MTIMEPTHVPGDIVNGHVLTHMPDGSYAWLPLAPAPKAPVSKAPVSAAYRDLFGVPITPASLVWRIPLGIIDAIIFLVLVQALGLLTATLIVVAVMLACWGLGKLFRQGDDQT